MTTRPKARLRTVMLARSLLIQGSWNYETMIGPGFAFTLLPALRDVYGDDEEALAAAVQRHSEHFNAHPYLAPIAVGVVARLEADGADESTVRRLKTAIRGPLGGLGDTLVWATWLPLVAVAALALYWFGVPGWVAVLGFVAVYNAGHLVLRAWGLRTGLDAGREIGGRLGTIDLGGWATRLQGPLVAGLGVLCGVLAGSPRGLAGVGPELGAVVALGFVVGLVVGHRVWRPAAVVTVSLISFLGLWGFLS